MRTLSNKTLILPACSLVFYNFFLCTLSLLKIYYVYLSVIIPEQNESKETKGFSEVVDKTCYTHFGIPLHIPLLIPSFNIQLLSIHLAMKPQLNNAIGQYLSFVGIQVYSIPSLPKGQILHNFLLHILGTKSKVMSNCSG